MIKKMGFEWHLRLRMAGKGMFQTSDLVPLLAERGVTLSREQVFRLVTQPPQRLTWHRQHRHQQDPGPGDVG